MGASRPDIDDEEALELEAMLEMLDEAVESISDCLEPAGLSGLAEWIRQMHGVEAEWDDCEEVELAGQGELAWRGFVQVFRIEHPEALRVYAWSDEAAPSGKVRCHSVLRMGEITSARKAVCSVLLAMQRAS